MEFPTFWAVAYLREHVQENFSKENFAGMTFLGNHSHNIDNYPTEWLREAAAEMPCSAEGGPVLPACP